jgi:excisionase family DNA binding protein
MKSNVSTPDAPIRKLLYRVPEACEATGLSRATLYELIARGEIDVIHVGTAVRIPVASLEGWLEKKLGDRATATVAG